MIKIVLRVATTIIPVVLTYNIPALAPQLIRSFVTSAAASPAGDSCRKDICDAVVAACMRADFSLNPLARTEVEKNGYCAGFFPGA